MMLDLLIRLVWLLVVGYFAYMLAGMIWELLQILAPHSPEIKAWVKTIKQAQKRAKAWWQKVTAR